MEVKSKQKIKRLLVYLFFLFLIVEAAGQRQLVILYGDQVANRIKVGSKIKCVLKNSKEVLWGFVVEVNKFDFITSRDTIPIREIKKISTGSRGTLLTNIGKGLVIAGTGYFLADQFNNIVISGNSPDMLERVWKPSAILTGIGLPMLLLKKKWDRPGRRARLHSIDYTSRFYSVD